MIQPTKKDYIQLKELILSLRKKYQENNQELDELKSNIYGLDYRIKDFFFYVVKYSGEQNPNIMLKFIENRGALWRLRDNISKFRGDYDYTRTIAKLWTDFNNHYKIIGHYPAKIADEKEFTEKINTLLSSEFYKNIHTPNITVQNEYLDGTLNVNETGVFFYAFGPKQTRNIISYNGREDTLEHRLSKEEPPAKRTVYLLNTLSTPIKVTDLPAYHQKTIDFTEYHAILDQPLNGADDNIDSYDLDMSDPLRLVLRKK